MNKKLSEKQKENLPSAVKKTNLKLFLTTPLFNKLFFLTCSLTVCFWLFSFFFTEQKPIFTPLYAELNFNNFYLLLPLVLINYLLIFKILSKKKLKVFGLVLLSFTLLVSFNSLKKNISFYDILNDGNNYYYDALEIKDLKSFLKTYDHRIFYHRLHTRTHPPGPVLFHYFLNLVFQKQKIVNALVMVLISLLNLLVVFKLARFFKTKHKNLLLLLLLSSPGFLVYGATSMDSLFSLLIAWACLATLRLSKTFSWKKIIISSLVWFLASFFTYASVIIPLFAAFLGIIVFAAGKKLNLNLKNYLISLGLTVIVGGLLYLGLFLLTNFNPVKTFWAAKNFNTMLMPDIFMTAKRYFYSTTANLVEYLIFLGCPIFTLLLFKLKKTFTAKDFSLNFYYLVSFLTPLLLLNFSGIYKTGVWSGETGRIWLFLTPLIIGGLNIKNKNLVQTVSVLAFVQALLIQLSLNTFW